MYVCIYVCMKHRNHVFDWSKAHTNNKIHTCLTGFVGKKPKEKGETLACVPHFSQRRCLGMSSPVM